MVATVPTSEISRADLHVLPGRLPAGADRRGRCLDQGRLLASPYDPYAVGESFFNKIVEMPAMMDMINVSDEMAGSSSVRTLAAPGVLSPG